MAIGMCCAQAMHALDVEIDGLPANVPTDIAYLGDVMATWAVKRTDQVRWYRSAQVAAQTAHVQSCREQARGLTTVQYRLKDLVTRDVADAHRALMRLVESFEPTGRVLAYGPLDPARIRVDQTLNRRLRPTDRIEILTDPFNRVWTWDVGAGYQARPHAPTNTAYHYGADRIDQGFARGDFAYVIDPHGQVSKVGIARYNRSNRAIAPGSMVFFPPSGFGRSDQSLFVCIANAFAFHRYWHEPTGPWWAR